MDMSNQKGFAKIILIIGVVILVSVAGYFIVSQQKPSSLPAPSPNQNSAPTLTPTLRQVQNLPRNRPVSI